MNLGGPAYLRQRAIVDGCTASAQAVLSTADRSWWMEASIRPLVYSEGSTTKSISTRRRAPPELVHDDSAVVLVGSYLALFLTTG